MSDKHLDRNQLVTAARQRQLTENAHLTECTECRELVELLRSFDCAGRLHLPDAPNAWVERAIALIAGQKRLQRIQSLVARIVFDSWTMPQPLGVRGESVESDRRIRFETDRIRFDLRAERQEKGWAFVAQVKGHATVAIHADKKEYLPDSAGLYQWSGTRPPRHITLRADEFVIELPELSWKRPQSK